MTFSTVYSKKTGQKRRIPTAWLGHPRLGAPFSKTPPRKGGNRAAPAITEKNTRDIPATPEKGA